MGGDRAASAQEPARCPAGRRPAGDLGHRVCAEGRLSLVRLPGRLWAPPTTIYDRFDRWSRRGFWLKLLDALVDAGVVTKSTAIDSTYIKAQRAAFGGKGGARFRRSVARAADGRPRSMRSPTLSAAPMR